MLLHAVSEWRFRVCVAIHECNHLLSFEQEEGPVTKPVEPSLRTRCGSLCRAHARFRGMWILWLLLIACPIVMYAQKVNVGYDKTADFSKYKTYTWVAPAVPPSRPVLYSHVVATIDDYLKLNGLKRVPEKGDLMVASGGGIGFGSSAVAGAPVLPTYVGPPPSLNTNMWVGTSGLAPILAEGTLMLEFVDRKANNIVWSGSVSDKLDIEKQSKSLERVNRAIAKLLAKFPPRTRS